MTPRYVWLFILASWLCVSLLASAQGQAPPSKYAVLIGIDKYQHPTEDIKFPDINVPRVGRDEPSLTYPDLAGPTNDVESIRQVLATKFQFLNDPGHMVVLLDEQAKHDNIMKAMQKYLVDTPQKEDVVVLYVSSHGSLRIYPKGQGDGQLYNLLGDERDQRHAENTLVPYDWYEGVDDIFSRDLRHIFRQAADKGVHVTAIFDTCHSGSLGRGLLNAKLVSRDFDFDPREMMPNPYAKEERPTLPQDDPIAPTLILSAAQKDQLAIDDQTHDPEHGIFTSALVEALNALPEDRPVTDVFSRLQVSMELAPDSIHQQPEIDTTPERRRQPIFGGEAAHGPSTAAVVQVTSDGALLDIGIVADIGPGSIFTSMPIPNGRPVELKVTTSLGLGRSLAQVQPPGSVKAGDIVQLKATVPWKRPDLLVYAGTSNPSLADVQYAVAAVRTANLTLTPDPTQDPWEYHVYWDATHWTLCQHSKLAVGVHPKLVPPVNLGPKLTAQTLSRVPAGSVVWFDPPLPSEAAEDLLPAPTGDAPHLAARITADRGTAVYVIGSTLTKSERLGNTVSYAWFKRSDVDAEVQTPKWMGEGCSPGSSYPLRTNWIDKPSPASTAEALSTSAVKLAKLNGWFLLQSSPLSEHGQFPYTLALRSANGGENIGQNGTTYSGSYYLYLTGTPTPHTQPKWVYVLNIDCQGNGTVVWPYDAPPDRPDKPSVPAAMFPVDDKHKLATEIKLPGDPFPVQAPLGTDTYILLSTLTRLSDYHALEFDRVVAGCRRESPRRPAGGY